MQPAERYTLSHASAQPAMHGLWACRCPSVCNSATHPFRVLACPAQTTKDDSWRPSSAHRPQPTSCCRWQPPAGPAITSSRGRRAGMCRRRALPWCAGLSSSLVVLPFALPHLRADWPKLKNNAGLMLLFAAVGGGAFGTLQFVALHFTTALNMGVVGSVAPAFIVAVSWLLFRDRLSALQLIGRADLADGRAGHRQPARCRRVWRASASTAATSSSSPTCCCGRSTTACLRLRPDVHPMTFMLSMAVIAGLGNLPFAAAGVCVRLSACNTPG